MQDTPFSEMYDVKKKEASGETVSFLALIHKIPKQIADSAQTQGVSEKFLENGMPSGVLTPSQISHDRMLSVTDAIQDATIIGILLAFMPLFDYGLWMSIFAGLICLYWFFHVAWWEKSNAWNIKASVNRYIRNTYNYYWSTLIVATILVSLALWYLIFLAGAHLVAIQSTNIALEQASIIEKAFAGMFGPKWFSSDPQHFIEMKGIEYQIRFAVAYVIFIAVTYVSKTYFSKFYKHEKSLNEEHSEEEMLYTAESALRKLNKGVL